MQFFWQQNGELWITTTPYQGWRNLPASTHQRLFNLKIWLQITMTTCHQIKIKKNTLMNSWWWILKKNLTLSYTCNTHGNGKKKKRINWVFTGSYFASVRAHYYKYRGCVSVFFSALAGLGLFTANHTCSNLMLKSADSVYKSFPFLMAAIAHYWFWFLLLFLNQVHSHC